MPLCAFAPGGYGDMAGRARKLHFGLTPKKYQSGETDVTGPRPPSSTSGTALGRPPPQRMSGPR